MNEWNYLENYIEEIKSSSLEKEKEEALTYNHRIESIAKHIVGGVVANDRIKGSNKDIASDVIALAQEIAKQIDTLEVSKSEIKPCPFCHGEVLIAVSSTPKGETTWHTYCTKCYCKLSAHKTRELAVQAWNTRPADH